MGVFVGGDNCGELNGWFCVFCNCCWVFDCCFCFVRFLSPFSVLSLPHFPFSQCRRVTTTTVMLTHKASRSTHNNTHQLTPKERTTHLKRARKNTTETKTNPQRIKRGRFTARTLYSGYLSSCKREFLTQIASPELRCQNQPIRT